MDKKIDVDEIVNNNSSEENNKIVREMETIKQSLKMIREFRDDLRDTGLEFEDIEKIVVQKFKTLAETHTTVVKKAVYDDDISMIYNMIDAQIAVAKKEKKYKDVSDEFGKILHDKYVKS